MLRGFYLKGFITLSNDPIFFLMSIRTTFTFLQTSTFLQTLSLDIFKIKFWSHCESLIVFAQYILDLRQTLS